MQSRYRQVRSLFRAIGSEPSPLQKVWSRLCQPFRRRYRIRSGLANRCRNPPIITSLNPHIECCKTDRYAKTRRIEPMEGVRLDKTSSDSPRDTRGQELSILFVRSTLVNVHEHFTGGGVRTLGLQCPTRWRAEAFSEFQERARTCLPKERGGVP